MSITDLAGTTLDLGSVRENDTITTVRRRVADLWGVAVERVDLLHNSGALADADHHRVVRDVFTVDDTLLAARQPCRARPTDYESHILRGCGFFKVCHVSFPAPKDININMMPFIFGDESSLPEECRGYWEMTQRCRPHGYYRSSEDGKVCFLTIQEGMVEKGLSQRRPGVHVERSEVEVKGWRDDRLVSVTNGKAVSTSLRASILRPRSGTPLSLRRSWATWEVCSTSRIFLEKLRLETCSCG